MSKLLRNTIVGKDIFSFKDTQGGFKAFRGEIVHSLFGILRIDRLMSDVELLYSSVRLGYRTYEMPVRWTIMPGSRLGSVRGFARKLGDLAMIRFIHRDPGRQSRAMA